MREPTSRELLDAALARDWFELSASSGLSAPRLTQMALRAIDDPKVAVAFPIECGQLRRRRDAARARR